jgi:acylphosphatase
MILSSDKPRDKRHKMLNKRVRAIISGRVQGVCFRMETERAAAKYGVYGWVRNRRDGTVEALFEGPAAAVEDILKWCGEGPPLAMVARVEIAEEPFKGEFKDFTIRYTA